MNIVCDIHNYGLLFVKLDKICLHRDDLTSDPLIVALTLNKGT